MDEKYYLEVVSSWFNGALVLTGAIWVFWFVGRFALSLIEIKK